jgi:hypothetical protein
MHAAKHRSQNQTDFLLVPHFLRPATIGERQLCRGRDEPRGPVQRTQVSPAEIFRGVERRNFSTQRAAKTRRVKELDGSDCTTAGAQGEVQTAGGIAQRRDNTGACYDNSVSH